MSTVIYNPNVRQQTLPFPSALHSSTAWPAARVKRVALRVLQIVAVSLVLASIPDDSGPIRHQAPLTISSTSTVSNVSFVRALTAADR